MAATSRNNEHIRYSPEAMPGAWVFSDRPSDVRDEETEEANHQSRGTDYVSCLLGEVREYFHGPPDPATQVLPGRMAIMSGPQWELLKNMPLFTPNHGQRACLVQADCIQQISSLHHPRTLRTIFIKDAGQSWGQGSGR